MNTEPEYEIEKVYRVNGTSKVMVVKSQYVPTEDGNYRLKRSTISSEAFYSEDEANRLVRFAYDALTGMGVDVSVSKRIDASNGKATSAWTRALRVLTDFFIRH